MTVDSSNIVNLRIEGLNDTLYEGPIFSGPRNITTASGGTHLCDGTEVGENPQPGNTPLAALDAASKLVDFSYDGTWSDAFLFDYLITTIGSDTSIGTNQFWAVLINYAFSPGGPCQIEVGPADQVVWAFDAIPKNAFLKVEPWKIIVKKGRTKTVTVTNEKRITVDDPKNGAPAEGALIDGVTTDANGKAVLKFPKRGVFRYKATRSDAIRSNALVVIVVWKVTISGLSKRSICASQSHLLSPFNSK